MSVVKDGGDSLLRVKDVTLLLVVELVGVLAVCAIVVKVSRKGEKTTGRQQPSSSRVKAGECRQ